MAKIFPFCGIIYNKKKLKNLSNVLSPPYDVIPSDMQDMLYNISDYNMVRLILGKEFAGDNEYNNKYMRAAASFQGWLRHGILVQDEKPAVYVYEQKFVFNRKTYSRIGLIALLRLEEFGKGKIYPHEHTLSKPKFDRIELIKATSANFDCIFSLFSDEKNNILKVLKKQKGRRPDLEIKDKEGILNGLWRVTQKSTIEKLMKEFKDKPVFIADGHHRYEAALRFKNEMKTRNTRFMEEESYNHVMMFFTPVENPGLVVLPIHRMVKELPSYDPEHLLLELGAYFDVSEIKFGKKSEKNARKKLLKALEKNKDKHVFGLYLKESPNIYYILSLKDEAVMQDVVEEDKPVQWKTLDVTILRALVFEKILNVREEDNLSFTKSSDEALDSVKTGKNALAVILNPTKIEDVIAIASKYEKMPQKSTYFYPKLTTGMVINKIIHGERIA